MAEFSWRTRLEAHAQLAREPFDLLIIGGGITGAGLALDAAARGLRVALVEKRDFAAGTSSRSTKLVHGGLRYLEHFDFAMVREGLRERALLVRLAPHLVEPFPFLIPVYRDPRRNYDRPLKMRAGLWLYDLLAARYQMGRHRRLSREEALELAPQLDDRGLKGAFLYYDCRTDDSRLVIEVIKSARQIGAAIANYTRVVGFSHDRGGRIAAARVRDELSGAEFEARVHLVINATGIWLDEVRDLAAGGEAGGANGAGKRLRPSKGVHLLVAADRLRLTTAWLVPSLSSHRFYFVVPWQGRVLIGTTDTDYTGSKETPRAEAAEVNEILEAVNSYFPAARLTPADVIATFAGLRPLISPAGPEDTIATTEVSRAEEVFEGADGLISIAGGKLTTYRHMAERVIDRAVERLAARGLAPAQPRSRTAEVVIGGGALGPAELERQARQLSRTSGLPLDTALHLARYGTELQRVAGLAGADERLGRPLVEDLPFIAAEVVYAARHEMALTLADTLTRRVRLAMLAGVRVLECAPAAAALMAEELGWDRAERDRQTAAFTAEFEREFAAPRQGLKALSR